MTTGVVPCTTDVDTGGFWEATRRHSLAVLFCAECNRPLHLPKQYCAACGSFSTQWRDVAPLGRLYSWTVVRRAILAGHQVPYTVVLIELDDFPEVRLLGELPGFPELTAGQHLIATFEDHEEYTLPVWRLR